MNVYTSTYCPRFKVFGLALFFLVLSAFKLLAQSSEYDLKAFFLWKIAEYIEWPEEKNKSKEFIIGVIGENPFNNILETVYVGDKRKIKGKPVVIKYFKEVSNIGDCHILFISNSESSELFSILEQLANRSILTVADSENFGRMGVNINFFNKDGSIKFELNEESVKLSGLKVDYRLRNIAQLVKTKK